MDDRSAVKNTCAAQGCRATNVSQSQQGLQIDDAAIGCSSFDLDGTAGDRPGNPEGGGGWIGHLHQPPDGVHQRAAGSHTPPAVARTGTGEMDGHRHGTRAQWHGLCHRLDQPTTHIKDTAVTATR